MRSKFGGLTLPDYRPHFKTSVIKTVGIGVEREIYQWIWSQKNTEWNRIGSPNTYPQILTQCGKMKLDFPLTIFSAQFTKVHSLLEKR